MLMSKAAITYVNVYFINLTLITQAKKLSFKDPLVACCGHGGKYNFNKLIKCVVKYMVKGKEHVLAKSCNDVSSRVSWDGVHLPETANRWIFQQINMEHFLTLFLSSVPAPDQSFDQSAL
ncbi:hypothetical protein Bca4012_063234 [Brassica carinata]